MKNVLLSALIAASLVCPVAFADDQDKVSEPQINHESNVEKQEGPQKQEKSQKKRSKKSRKEGYKGSEKSKKEGITDTQEGQGEKDASETTQSAS